MKSEYGVGLVFGVGAYVVWGLLPVYWRFLERASAFEILAHRGIWSLLLCFALLRMKRQLRSTLALLRVRRLFLLLLAASGFLTVNWGVYIWSVSEHRVVESALGYYITPLVSVVFGVIGLKEHLRLGQRIAVGAATVGVIIFGMELRSLPWIPLAIALSWGCYSLVKKHLGLGALETLSLETLFALIPNLIFLIVKMGSHEAEFGTSFGFSIALVGAGVATVVPLLLFNGATTRLPLSTNGLLQYITPTLMFILGVIFYGEPMPLRKLLGFVFIWAALIFLGTDLVRNTRSMRSGDQKVSEIH